MTIHSPTVAYKTAATTTSYAQLEAAASADKPRIHLEVENTNDTDSLILAVGASGSEVAIATIAPGKSKTISLLTCDKLGFNLVPQGRLAIKSSANTPTYNSTTVATPKITLA